MLNFFRCLFLFVIVLVIVLMVCMIFLFIVVDVLFKVCSNLLVGLSLYECSCIKVFMICFSL